MNHAVIFLAVIVFTLVNCKNHVSDPQPTAESTTPVSYEQPNPAPTPIDTGSMFTPEGIESKVGIVSTLKDDHLCVRGLNAKLIPDDEIYLITPYERPHVITKIRIVRKVARSCVDDDSDIGDEEDVIKNTSYYLAIAVGVTDEYQILSGFAVLDPTISPKLEKGIATAELTGSAPPEYFRECTSFEGMHFTVWAGKPLVSKRIWHRYYYLHYDTVPTCKKKDYE
jgi:hypothetical protein